MSNPIILPHKHDSSSHDVMERSPSHEDFETVAALMKQLGDPSRLRIFWLLCHTQECVANIAALVEMSSPAVSHHLRVLKSAGLIVSRRDGKEMLYKAADTEMAEAMHQIIENLAQISCPSEHHK